ncbi:MAG: sensor histidine kinase [Acidimicrobiia bacterium]
MRLAGWAASLALGCGLVALAGRGLGRGLRRIGSLRAQVLVVTLVALATGALVAVVLARAMVLDAGEVRRVVGVLALTAGFATVLVLTSLAPLGRDVRRIEVTVRALEGGDRTARAGVDRDDELGHVARALDDVMARLDQLESERQLADRQRRTMFSHVSHDLRTPLSALRAALEALQDGLTPDPHRYLRSMERDVAALTSLVDDLFLLARIEAGEVVPLQVRVDLAEIADEAVEALAPVATAHDVGLVVDGGAAAMVLGDPVALGRVVRNLVDNAIRHSPPGSTVRVVVHDDGRPTVRVVDQGAGFPAAFRGAAFDRFSRADTSRSRTTGGAGLGLAIARGLVEAHDGAIWIEDPPPSCVAFSLPVPPQPGRPAGRAGAS